MASRIQTLFHLSLWLLVGTASCASMAAWWVNDVGPALMMQDDESGGIRYSLCNSNSTPIFPNDTTLIAPLNAHLPKMNTSLAGAGWFTGGEYFASIFYQDDQDRIVNSLLQCDTATGQWDSNGDWIISDGGPAPSPTTGLAVILLGAEDGYRVFYNDIDGRVHAIAYTSDTERWLYNGVVSGDNSTAHVIAATFPNDNNITVVTPKDAENMEISRLYGDGLWHVSTFPTPLTLQGPEDSFFTNATNATRAGDFRLNSTFTPSWRLPAWDGQPAALGMAEDRQYTRSIFYIGTDSNLHQIGNLNFEWREFERPADGDAAWPPADPAAGGQLAVASDFSTSQARVYYRAAGSGRLVEAACSRGIWARATELPSFNATAPSAAPGSETSDDPSGDGDDVPPQQGEGEAGLSPGAKAGIGVSISLGVFAIGGTLTAFLIIRRSQRRKDKKELEGSESGGGGKSPDYAHSQPSTGDPFHQQQHGGPWPLWSQPQVQQEHGWNHNNPAGSGVSPPVEMETSAIYEMSAHNRPQEMLGEGHYREMDPEGGRR
ncbi:hypothetical protein DL770_010289 [Monosporascus sp. CRB-9-2]|nr:hypothetical protein DL770_010289 [Monosporascus sp. CRB-9-2]